MILDESPDLPVTPDNHLVQEFEIPEGAYPVRMQTGSAPVAIVGWVTDGESLPELLESVAAELRKVMAERDSTHD